MRHRRSLRSKTTPRLRQKLSWQYVAAGIAVAAIAGIGLFFFFNLGMGGESKAAGPYQALIYSNQSGNWMHAESWSPRTPQAGDSIIIKEGHTLTVSDMITINGVHLAVYGTLFIENGRRITLRDDAEIVIHPGGSIDGGNDSSNGSRINYENTTLWASGMGPIDGYSRLDQDGYHKVNTLPVELVYFRGKAEKQKAVLEWATASELNNDFFSIERSSNGIDFQQVATVEGAGNSNNQLSYTYTDGSAPSGTSYYRLKQTDYDGKFEYFKLLAVNLEPSLQNNSLELLSVGPNPFSYNFSVEFELPAEGRVELRLMNLQGNLVAAETIEGYMGHNRYSFNDRQGLMSGTYILSLRQQNISSKAIRLIKQ